MNLETKLLAPREMRLEKSEGEDACVQLVYISRAVKSENDSSLRDILGVARGYNAERGITGVLCFAYGRYLQVLEGPSREVNALYLRIGRDKRHEGVRLMKFTEMQTRCFGLWSMRMIRFDEQSGGEARALVRFNGFGSFEPELWSGEECLMFLRDMARVLPERG